jgi:hypothetical protein
MSSFETLRAAALALPEVTEGTHRGGPAFYVRGKTFALWWAEGGRTILRLDPNHQHFLFEIRPEVFEPCKVGTGTWSFVDLDQIDEAETAELVHEAWRGVAPKMARAAHPSG